MLAREYWKASVSQIHSRLVWELDAGRSYPKNNNRTIHSLLDSIKYFPKIQGYFLSNINCRMLWATAMNGTKKCGWQKVTIMPHFLNMRIRQCTEKIHQQRNISCHYHFRYNMQMRLIWTRIKYICIPIYVWIWYFLYTENFRETIIWYIIGASSIFIKKLKE